MGRPNVPDLPGLMRSVEDTLASGWLSNDGPRLREFEAKIEEVSGASYCVATNSGTSALQITARALGMTGEVIVPSFTFIATAHAFWWQNLKPVFVDVDPRTHCIDVSQVEERLSEGGSDISGVCGVHLWGNLCDTEALDELAAKFSVPVIYDGAHALACTTPSGVKFGANGAAEVVSFHATKFINAVEGGAVLTNDRELAEQLRQLRNFGLDETGDSRVCGLNAKLSEVGAAVGLHSLSHLDQIIKVNRRNHERYKSNLRGVPGINIVSPTDPEHSNCQYVVAEVTELSAGLSRQELGNYLRAEGVVAKSYFNPPCHKTEAYRTAISTPELPVTDDLASKLVCLPTGLDTEPEDIDKICELIGFICATAGKLAIPGIGAAH